jgi:hypothetical protein
MLPGNVLQVKRRYKLTTMTRALMCAALVAIAAGLAGCGGRAPDTSTMNQIAR